MNVLVVDAQGGGIGRQLVAAIKKELPGVEVIATGTNSAATSAMLKAGADHASTGENAIRVCADRADVIIGPIGIVIADSLYGEITPAMACAIGQSRAKRILLPMNHCDNIIVGGGDISTASLVAETLRQLKDML